MGGGLMQLVAYGAQDVYLTGNPQITFWKVTYRRHTNFAMESIEQTFNGQADFGRRVTCTISRNGDLAYRTYLQVTLPEINQQMLPANVTQTLSNPGQLAGRMNGEFEVGLKQRTGVYARWLDFPGHQLISMVEVEIGGQRIDRQYGDWMHIWNQLCLTAEQQRGYFKMVGNTTQLTFITDPNFAPVDGPCATTAPAQVCAPRNALPETTLYIPFQFWYCRNPGLALPLIALQYHEIRINLDLRPIDECLWAVTSLSSECAVPIKVATAYQQSLVAASLYVDYVFLDTDERRRMAQNPHEYLIEQLQFTGDESVGSSSNKIKLNFNHPCKELIWVVQPDANVDYCASLICSTALFEVLGAQPFNYTDAIDSLPNAIHAFGGPASLTMPTPGGAVITSTGRFQDAGADDVYDVFGWNMQYGGFLPGSTEGSYGGNFAIDVTENPLWSNVMAKYSVPYEGAIVDLSGYGTAYELGAAPNLSNTSSEKTINDHTSKGGFRGTAGEDWTGGAGLDPGMSFISPPTSQTRAGNQTYNYMSESTLGFPQVSDNAFPSGSNGNGLMVVTCFAANLEPVSNCREFHGNSKFDLPNMQKSGTGSVAWLANLKTALGAVNSALISLFGGTSNFKVVAHFLATDKKKTVYAKNWKEGDCDNKAKLLEIGGKQSRLAFTFYEANGLTSPSATSADLLERLMVTLYGALGMSNGGPITVPGATDDPTGGSGGYSGGMSDSGQEKTYRINDGGASGFGKGDLNQYPGSTVSDAGTFVLNETSLDMHCWGENPVVTAKLQLNGQDRFSEREGTYFDLVQPYQHHTRNPDTGINVYSFALRPEEHQPSGTCNFSRIDNATLQLVLSNATVGGTNTAKVRVYATNYNVLRIMSGMGGLAYSN
jgi:hypothetical protein